MIITIETCIVIITCRSGFAGLAPEGELADDQGLGARFSDDRLVHGPNVGAVDEVFLDLDVLVVIGVRLFDAPHPIVDVKVEDSGHGE